MIVYGSRASSSPWQSLWFISDGEQKAVDNKSSFSRERKKTSKAEDMNKIMQNASKGELNNFFVLIYIYVADDA